ncbi:PucR family transcriptional regulator [Gracilibacillus sp. HCP3S3_G5_1]|uniref:PucR family transcriptional regulator n=1 Tax=unclassified Gracilibacillus TaxID=2625209 RepID=UPI003F88FF49
MYLTIKEALAVYPFSESRLVAGANRLDRGITAVNIMDAPDIQNWVKEGELLLTTAFILKDNIDKAITLLRQLDKKSCAGLAIKLGRYWKEIPQAIIDTANQLDFPLFELPYSFTFSDQIKALYSEAHLQKEKWLSEKILIQKELITFPHENKDIDQYLEIVAKIIQHPFAVLTTTGDFLFNQTNQSEKELLQKWKDINKEPKKIKHADTYYQMELQDEQRQFGYLFIISEQDISKEEEMLFGQIGEILSDYFSKIYATQPEKLKEYSFNKWVKSFLNKQITLETLREKLDEQDQKLLEMPFWIVLIDHDTASTKLPIHDITIELEKHAYFKSYEMKHFHWNDYQFSIIFDPEATNRVFQRTNLFLPIFEEILGRTNSKQMLKLITSRQYNQLDALFDAFEECLHAKDLAAELDYNDDVIIVEELDFFSLFRHIPDQLMETFYQNIFESLLHDSTNFEKDMLATLETFIECNGNIKEVANRLFIHRNTVLYRLDKISNLLNIDLKNIDDLLRIKMALTFLQIKNIRQISS